MKVFPKIIVLMLVGLFAVPAMSLAQDYIEGKIQGASYVFNKTVQPESSDDPKVDLEREFVLQTNSGQVFFLVNVPRSMKVKSVNKTVRVYGEKPLGQRIFVHHIDIKENGKFKRLCDWDEKCRENAGN